MSQEPFGNLFNNLRCRYFVLKYPANTKSMAVRTIAPDNSQALDTFSTNWILTPLGSVTWINLTVGLG
ncbi:hypothetical protein TRIP_E190142 [uncultured Spirochaetota bacterium]|uniref:Uncharacterized protein n=1 Tax=uncultured Spirochaetota bacterium TaxID=460511 RepID=A0A652ZTW7_9SPIR|nr:hypothetical protein TRIP_E190142 [uncultured Spirochaetota bacterium]